MSSFNRRHAVTPEQEQMWEDTGKPVHGSSGIWVPHTIQGYAAILDHGIRAETRGIVLHVNDGFYHGTIGFFTNGLPEPYGSEGIGAHFEMGGQANHLIGEYADGPPYQFLPLDAVAFHAGEANGFTVGIEHAGFGYSTDEWTVTHYNMIGNSAYRGGWILRHYGLGVPRVSMSYPGPRGANVWPHHAGGFAWGGHQCPASTRDGVDYFPYKLWQEWATKAYNEKWPS